MRQTHPRASTRSNQPCKKFHPASICPKCKFEKKGSDEIQLEINGKEKARKKLSLNANMKKKI
jgi:predicted small metal-binding protein